MAEVTISLLQALQLAGLLPCAFVILLLVVVTRHYGRIVVPVCFFLSLICSFMQPLLSVLPWWNSPNISMALVLGETLQPALGFLLVIQFLTGKPPVPFYWLILALPIVGGSSLIYSAEMADELCVFGQYCIQTESLRMLYNIVASGMILLLLMARFSRSRVALPTDDMLRRHKYWLVIAFIALFIGLLSIELALLAEAVKQKEYLIAVTIIRISFIYLALTSLFRVFDDAHPFGVGKAVSSYRDKQVDQELLDKIEAIMADEKLYREMGFSRESLANKLQVGEHVVSKTINQHFGKNFNEYVNSYRVDEAKRRLTQESTSVTAIAFEVGFSSIASFNRVFKAQTGCSPTEYRLQKAA